MAIMTTTPKDKPVRSLSLREYLRKAVDGHTLTTLAAASGISYSTLRRHVVEGNDMRPQTARKLETWSSGRISFTKTMSDPPMTKVATE